MNGKQVLLCTLVACTVSCTKPIDQAEEYYNLEKYDLSFKMANQAYNRDKTNAKAAVILFKSQIAAKYCNSQKIVAGAYSAIQGTVTRWDESIIAPLQEALTDRKGCIQLFAVYALGDLPFEDAGQLLLDIVRGSYPEPEEPGLISKEILIGEAALVLGKRVYKGALDDLIRLTGSESGLLRAKSAEALGYLGEQQAVEPLTGLLKDQYSVGGERIVAEAARVSLKLLTDEDYSIED